MGIFVWKIGQWSIRFLQGCCATVVLALTCYFISTQDNRELTIHVWERAVAGISGAALVYIIAQAVLLCCLAGFLVTSGLTMLFDLAFIGAFMYIAWAYRDGASSCSGDVVDTPYGPGQPQWEISEHVGGNDGWTRLPTYREACNMERASLAVSILAIFLFVASILLEWKIVKKHREEKNVAAAPSMTSKGKGLFGFRKNKAHTDDSNVLPQHPSPTQTRDVEKADHA